MILTCCSGAEQTQSRSRGYMPLIAVLAGAVLPPPPQVNAQ